MAKEREKAIYDKAGRDDLALKEIEIQGMMSKEPSEQEIYYRVNGRNNSHY